MHNINMKIDYTMFHHLKVAQTPQPKCEDAAACHTLKIIEENGDLVNQSTHIDTLQTTVICSNIEEVDKLSLQGNDTAETSVVLINSDKPTGKAML